MADTGQALSFSEFTERIERDHREISRRARRRLIILGILMVVVMGYTTWLYSQVAAMNAQAVAEITRGYLLTNLPEAKVTLRTALIENAPEVTDQAQEMMLELPRFIREQIEASLPPSSQALAARFEDDLAVQIDTAIESVVHLANEEGGASPTKRGALGASRPRRSRRISRPPADRHWTRPTTITRARCGRSITNSATYSGGVGCLKKRSIKRRSSKPRWC